MRRTSLLLISPPVLYDPRLWSARLPSKPHIQSLAGFVRDVADVRILDVDVEMGAPRSLEDVDRFVESLDDQIALDGVDVVGISCWTSFHYLGAVAVARSVRERREDVMIVVGGHHATAVPSDFTDGEGLFDVVVRGDGEHILRLLCQERPSRPSKPVVVDGIPFELVHPATVDWNDYPWHDAERRILWVNLSRGCPFECEFCVGRTRLSAYPVDDALDLLERLARDRAPELVCLEDPVFGADRRWTEALLDGIEGRGLGLKFWAETRADLMTPDLLDRLHACGFWVDFGLDTGSPTMVRHLCKSHSPQGYLERARTTLRHANAIGMPHLIYLLFNFLGETPDTARETMDFVEGLGGDSGPVSGMATSQTFFILPGTGAYDRMARNEAELGSRVRHPVWWKEQGDQYQMATDILPSAAFEGREDQLSAWQAWQKDLNVRWSPRRPKDVQALYRRMFGG